MTGKNKIISASCLSLVVLLLVGFYSYLKTTDYKKSSDTVNHTQEVITKAQKILLQVEDIETAQRGYVITGNSAYLEPYNKSYRSIKSACDQIKQLTKDNERQQKLLTSICLLIDEKINFAEKVIASRQNEGFESAQKLIVTNEGENLMTRIRSDIGNFIEHEETLLSKRLDLSNKNFTSSLYNIIVSVGLAALIILITLYFFIKDHQKRVLYEKKVSESEQRIKGFLEAQPVGVFVLDKTGAPFYANTKSKEILGKGIIADVSSSNLAEVYNSYIAGTNTIYPAEKQPIIRALKGEKNIGIDDMEIEKNSIRIPLRVNATNITNSEGEIEYAIAVFEDITEAKESEKKLIETRKMAEESAILKEAFLANMSHEIRTPMNAILGFTDLLLKKNLGEQETDFVKTIKTSGESLLRIINDILDVSKMESGMMTFEKQSISIKEIFASLHAMLSPRASDKSLSLTFDHPPELPDIVTGDPTRLTQILINLVGNAIKFTKKGRVNVFAKTIKKEKENVWIEFSVADTGIGIAEDKIKGIFERFQQAESHTARHYGGTGLGLSIAKELVEMQGGEMSVKSRPGLGSVFTFTLPFSTVEVKNKTKETKLPETDFQLLAKKNILLVEDNPINTKFVNSLFAEYGISADHAEDGAIAIEKIKSKEYDVVLMDIDMPNINGYEATLIIRNELKKSTPIIAMTAHAIAGEREKCLELGMNDYISKPVREDILFDKLYQQAVLNIQKTPEISKIVNLGFLAKSMRDRKDVIRETIDLILKEMPADLDALNKAVTKSDFSGIKQYAHKLKSTVSIAGIAEMLSILAQMESIATQGNDIEQIKKQNEWLVSLGKQAIEELKQERERFI